MSEDLSKSVEEFNKEISTEEETPEDRERKEKEQQKEVINRVIRGVNDIFEKEYNFEDLGMKFKIKLRAPNAVDVGKISARVSAYLGGMNNYASEYMLIVFQALAAIQEVGVEVPEELQDPEKIYNLDILYTIGRDFQRWLGNFRA